MIVVDAAIMWYHARGNQDLDQVLEAKAALVRATQNLIYSCPECNTDTHRCPGCASPIGHFQDACPQCEDDSTSSIVRIKPDTTTYPCIECITDPTEDPRSWCDCGGNREMGECAPPCVQRAHIVQDCPNGPPAWTPATFAECLAGDRIRLDGEETTVIRSSRGEWHADSSDSYHPRPWPHEELRLELEANHEAGLIQYPAEMAIEILCTPARRAALLLQKTFPGSTEVR